MNFFLPHPRLAPAPNPTGVKILLARVSRVRVRARVRVRVAVLASGHPWGRGTQRAACHNPVDGRIPKP